MRPIATALGLTLTGLLTLLAPERAEACGGCFHSDMEVEPTQVTGHRMALSVSLQQTTLYDQIEYVGAPEDFAWILPIRGQVEVGLSSDALFSVLESMTQVQIFSPDDGCPSCSNGSGGGFLGAGGGGGGGIEIITQETIGPYDTVQLSSTDPSALVTWLESSGYAIPDEIVPVIDAYVDEGFDFLALRLAPGEGVQSMRPVRVTTPGAGFELPLRMIAAGTGAKTSVTLWVLGEGRYQPENFPTFTVSADELTWDWNQGRSDYVDVRAAKFASTDGFGWHLEAGEASSFFPIDDLVYLARFGPETSGYETVDEAQADVDVLKAGISEDAFWVSRMTGELPRDALAQDLRLEAAPQVPLDRLLFVTSAVGAPTCAECPGGQGGNDGQGLFFNFGGAGGAGANDGASTGSSGGCDGCRTSSGDSGTPLLSLALALSATVARMRRRARRDS
jgi:hypothetical protein